MWWYSSASFHLHYFLLGIFRIVLADQGLINNYDLFAADNSLSDSSVFDDPTSDLLAWDPNNEIPIDGENSLFAQDKSGGDGDLFSPLDSNGADQTASSLFLAAAAGCPSASDTLKARDDNTPALLCPTNDLSVPVPRLPATLDDLTNQLNANGHKEDVSLDLVEGSKYPSPLPLLSTTEKDFNCPFHLPFRLCCLCNPRYEFIWCTDCVLSRFFPFSFDMIFSSSNQDTCSQPEAAYFPVSVIPTNKKKETKENENPQHDFLDRCIH